MLRRSTKVQLLLFVLVTVLGVGYVGAEYVGLSNGLFDGGGCTVSADFSDSGGIFSGAEVTYRGVNIGEVGSINLKGTGVNVTLHIRDCGGPKIPSKNVYATVSDRSVIGEQYVNIIPQANGAPYLRGGEVIDNAKNSVPIAPEQLLTDLNDFTNSVPTDKLTTVIHELGIAFNGTGQDLRNLLTSTDTLVQAANNNLDTTEQLIDFSATVLKTQLDKGSDFKSFSLSLNQLSQQLVKSNGDINTLITNGPSDFSTLRSFIADNRTDLGITLANLASTGQLLVRYLPGLEQVFELYPALASGAQTVLHTDSGGYGALGIVVNNTDPSNSNDPPDCGDPAKGGEGYGGTNKRLPNETGPAAPNVGARCTSTNPNVNVRGSANVPGGDPVSVTGGGVAYQRTDTQNTVHVGTVSAGSGELGDASWIPLLTQGLH